ncbi:MAG: tRNA (N(6)-L-threonylcarbamoyladenosine(37)-C(2))-methylthiotransferase MtaB, partial [Dethiobacteria bacterium]
MKKAAFYTLGCKVNYYETEALKSLFEKEGYTITGSEDEEADVYIINTCTVTHLSDRKSRQLIRKIRRRAPEATIAVTG